MSSEPEIAIRIDQLSKMYKIYSHPSDMFWEMVSGKPRFKPFWALQDITFQVPRGNVVGIMGRNGAGKSTLLKIISGTLNKTSGDVVVQGRISSILELGTGFNPEYTGRQNIYLGGLMVGMTQDEVNRKMDWIIEFSELESVIDQAFKTYSTGMQARLTFSTAVCIDPDILIIDEALAVGDAKFAKKSYGKIQEFRDAGHTILLVSHNVNTISDFCDHAILLEEGKIYAQGKPYEISQIYYQLLFSNTAEPTKAFEKPQEPVQLAAGEITEKSDEDLPHAEAGIDQPANLSGDAGAALSAEPEIDAPIAYDRNSLREFALRKLKLEQSFNQDNSHQNRLGNKKAEILDYGILDEQGNRVALLASGEKYRFYSRAVFYEDVHAVTSGFVIRNSKGVDVFGTSSLVQKLLTVEAKAGTIVESCCDVTMWLTNGIFFLSVSVADPYAIENVQYDLIYDAFQFEVRMKEGIFTTSVVNLDPQPIVRKIIWGEAVLVPLKPYVLASIH